MKRRCVFLDRDGTINVSPAPGECLLSWEEFQFLPGVVDWIRLFNALDFLVVVVTNQRAVARGILSMDTLEDINQRMVEALSEQGAHVDDVFCCPHEIGECECTIVGGVDVVAPDDSGVDHQLGVGTEPITCRLYERDVVFKRTTSHRTPTEFGGSEVAFND